MVTRVYCVGDLCIYRNFIFVDEIDGVCTIYPVFTSLYKVAPLVAQASGPCFLIRSIDETINSFSCDVLAEDVLRLMLRYMLCR